MAIPRAKFPKPEKQRELPPHRYPLKQVVHQIVEMPKRDPEPRYRNLADWIADQAYSGRRY